MQPAPAGGTEKLRVLLGRMEGKGHGDLICSSLTYPTLRTKETLITSPPIPARSDDFLEQSVLGPVIVKYC